MGLVYLITSGFFFLMAVTVLYHFRRKNLSFTVFVVWFFCFVGLGLLSLSPDLVFRASQMFGMQIKANFILTVLFVITSAYIWTQNKNNYRLKREQIYLTQLVSIHQSQFRAAAIAGAPQEVRPMPRVLVKMAAYNEAKAIGPVLDRIPKDMDVLVIDDGSQDDTAEMAERHGAIVVRHLKNMGQGVGDLTGFLWAADRGYEYIIEMDADGQHDPAALQDFCRALDDNPDCDLVTGSRVLGKEVGRVAMLRKHFLPYYTKAINWASGYNLTDALCGYKAYRTESLKKVAHLFQNIFETEYIAAEMYIRFGRQGLKVMEIPVTIYERSIGSSRKGTLRYGIAVLWVIVRSVIVR